MSDHHRKNTPRLARDVFALLTTGVLLTIPGCKEEFPPYEEPRDVLVGSITVTAPDTIVGYWDYVTQSYSLNTSTIFRVTVENTYDNLLQGKARVNGQLTIQSFTEIPRICVVPLTIGNLRRPPLFVGNLALGPGASAEFSVIWLPIATDRNFVFEGTSYILVGKDRYYDPITFIATAEVQLFERVQPIRFGQLQFKIVFKITEA